MEESTVICQLGHLDNLLMSLYFAAVLISNEIIVKGWWNAGYQQLQRIWNIENYNFELKPQCILIGHIE